MITVHEAVPTRIEIVEEKTAHLPKYLPKNPLLFQGHRVLLAQIMKPATYPQSLTN